MKFQRKASHSGSGTYEHHNNEDAQPNDLQKYTYSAASDKASEDVGNFEQLHRENNSGVGIQENTLSSSVAPSPSFTFDVCCEDGIQLFVDLNSSLSDWIENLKAGVHICSHMHEHVSQSSRQDIGLLCSSKQKTGSVIGNLSKGVDNGQLEGGSYATNLVADTQVQIDEPDKSQPLSNAFDSMDNSQAEQVILSSELNFDTQGKLPGVLSGIREETLAVDSGLDVVVQTGNCHDFTGNSVPSDHGSLDAVLKCSKSSTLVCTEMQTSTCDTLNHNVGSSLSEGYRYVESTKQLKNSEVVKSVQTSTSDKLQSRLVQEVDQSKYVSSSPLLNSCSLDLPDNKSKFKRKKGIMSCFRKTDSQIGKSQEHSTENDGFPRTKEAGIGTDEQKKDATLHSCYSDGPLDLVDPKKNCGDHGKSTESNEDDIHKIPSTAALRELGTTDAGNENEGLKCFNSKDQLELPCKRPNSESNGELKKKSRAKGPRSSKQFVGDIHSKRRQSSQLFTK